MNEDLPTVIAENNLTLAPDLTIKVLMLSDGNRTIPEVEMQRACEWLGVNLSTLQAMTLTNQRRGGDEFF
ncbi:hypothetical protein [Izhakiella capsodis]|uniref:hypothetical protein n=1 Tax=Izhakiella capsodis TaxID=1367852 RepID=UPI000B80A14A|nr:hypothetical protein [Izhakiella capsodis]